MCTLYIIDDDPIYQRILVIMNSRIKLFRSIAHYNEARQVITYIVENKDQAQKLPDVIFLDLNMPGFDGWQFLDAVERIYSSLAKKMTIYIVTTSILQADKIRAEAYPFVEEFISKPLTMDKLSSIYTEVKTIYDSLG